MINWLYNLFQDREFGATRSPKWENVRKVHLDNEPLCAVCKTKGSFLNRIEVHHIVPFYIAETMELLPSNLITLCRTHHKLFGHLGSWKSYNTRVLEDCLIWYGKIKTRPK